MQGAPRTDDASMTRAIEASWPYADAHQYLERLRHGMPPVIVCCACNGGIQGKEANPAIPESPEEVADSVFAAYQAGASMVHVHARDPANPALPASTVDVWADIGERIRQRCPDIIVNFSTGGGLGISWDERLACLDAHPDVASLNLTPDMSRFSVKARQAPLAHPRPAAEHDECLAVTYGLVRHIASEMRARGVKPELETYHTGGDWVIRDLIQAGLLDPPYWIQTVMGAQTASLPTADHVLHLLRELPPDTLWLCSGIGPSQLPMTTFAMLLGGHVRVGLEDNVYYRRGVMAESNAQLVERTVRIALELGREVATPSQARAMLGLPSSPGVG
jgi:3-keto-5-aminohexanoate cleavage enzyme